ncbi:uncharacterized protein LOC134854735 [Symsagittifera roscoffensis]|uniref:uncharacterized protein LOC134854735 n=2 Tax=Symsagittifera roscoffensis TaxID=84072 RepID=UPI00307C7361
MAHAQISVEPFGGSDNEDFAQFEQLFQGYVGVAGIANAQQANFLQLHLRDSALRFYQTLPALTRADVPLSLAALRDHFCNPQLQEVHVLKLEQSKFDIKRDSPENYLVNLTKKAQRAYPTPDLPAVAPIDGALADAAAAADTARFHRETAQRQERLDAENDHRNNQIKRLFIKGMPNWLRSKMMEQPAATTVQELCNLARKQMTIRDVCRNEDYPEDSFNEIGDTVSHNLISALSKLTTAQEQIEKQLNEVRSELSDQRKMIQSRPQRDNGNTQQSSQLNSQNAGGNNNQAQQQNQGNNAQNQGTGNGPDQGNTSGPNQGNGYQGNGQQGYNQRKGRFGKGKKNGQQRNDGGYGNQGFSGFQNMQYPPQMFQFPQQMPGMQSNPYFQQNQNYPQTQQNAQFYSNQMYPQGQQTQQQQAIATPPQQNPQFAQQVAQPMMQQVHTQNPNTAAVRTGSKFCDHCGKFGHTISQCWHKPKPQGQQQQNFPFQMEPKN